MKKLSKNNKTLLGVGAAALAVFALSGFSKSKTPKFALLAIDPDRNLIHYQLDGDRKVAAIYSGLAFYVPGDPNRHNLYAMPPANGIKKFVWRRGNEIIAELGRVDISAYPPIDRNINATKLI